MDFLDEDYTIESETEPKPRKQKRTKEQPTNDDKYVLSFAKFLESRKQNTETAEEEINDGNIEDLIIDDRNLENQGDDEYNENRGDMNGDDAPNGDVMVDESLLKASTATSTIVKPRHVPSTSTPRKQSVEGLNVTENRANNTRLYRIQKEIADVNQRLMRVEEQLAVRTSDGFSKLIWPIPTQANLEKLETALNQPNQQTINELTRRYRRGSRNSLYDFVHDNLYGLLNKCGRWTWTGKQRHIQVPTESIVSETLIDESELDQTVVDQSPKRSRPANSLKSVLLLHDLCFELFEGITDAELVKVTMRALTNINNANSKRTIRASGAGAMAQAGPSRKSN